MKKIVVLAAVAAAMLPMMSSHADAQKTSYYKGVGPVVAASQSESQLPKKAKKFLDKHFNGIEVTSVNVDYPSQNIDVTLADGGEVEFDAKGEVIEIEAPENEVLSDDLLRSVVSKDVYWDLRHRRLTSMVEGVTHDKYGYRVELNDNLYDAARYAEDGFLVALYTED